jgi:hypothetical protein
MCHEISFGEAKLNLAAVRRGCGGFDRWPLLDVRQRQTNIFVGGIFNIPVPVYNVAYSLQLICMGIPCLEMLHVSSRYVR